MMRWVVHIAHMDGTGIQSFDGKGRRKVTNMKNICRYKEIKLSL
jgi:hypothetical protein